LRAYQLSRQLAHLVYEASNGFPRGEYRLVGQMRGAAVSVFGNIAEEYGRNAIGDYVRFCEIARGSLAEVGSYVEFCQERRMFTDQASAELQSKYNHCWNTLGALIRSLRQKKLDGSWDRGQALRENEDSYNV
jgi:four helix bundle protein